MKKIYLIAILFPLLLVSCEDFLDVNKDPNNPVEVTPNLVLPVGQVYTAKTLQEDRGVSHLGNMLMCNYSEAYGFSWYGDEFQYLVNTTFYDDLFDDAFAEALKQYADLDDLDAEYAYYTAIGKIMKAYHFQMLVDLFGDIPYSDALQRGGNATPTYDDAETIYSDLLVQLTDAIAMIKAADLDPSVTAVGVDDVMFGGDMAEWIRFANTLKVRILTRASDVWAAATITAELATIAAEGSGYITDDVLVQPGYLNETDKQNTMWADLGMDVGGNVTLSNDATCATQYIVDLLAANNDPRIDFIYEEPATGHLGVRQGSGAPDTHAADFVSNIGPGILKAPTMGANIFTLAESYFNQAELAFKAFGGDAEALYDLGVTASFDYLGAAGAAAYLAQPLAYVNYALSPNKLQAIITQKWFATNGITAEQSWFDYSRTGYPLGVPVSLLATSADRPVRLWYPSSEITGNTLNVPAQHDAFTDKIFWGN